MATESGVILSVSSRTTGSITRDNGASPNPIAYDDPNLQITLTPGQFVTYDVDLDGNVTNIAPAVPIGRIVISANTTASYCLNSGESMQITNGAVLDGSVTLIGATLVIGQGSTITGNVVAINGSTVEIDTAIIGGDVDMFDGASYKSSHGTNSGDIVIKRNKSVIITNGSHQGDVNIKKSLLINMNGATVTGDVKIKKNSGVTITNNTINGDLILKNNTPPCVDRGNTVTGKHVPCQ